MFTRHAQVPSRLRRPSLRPLDVTATPSFHQRAGPNSGGMMVRRCARQALLSGTGGASCCFVHLGLATLTPARVLLLGIFFGAWRSTVKGSNLPSLLILRNPRKPSEGAFAFDALVHCCPSDTLLDGVRRSRMESVSAQNVSRTRLSSSGSLRSLDHVESRLCYLILSNHTISTFPQFLPQLFQLSKQEESSYG